MAVKMFFCLVVNAAGRVFAVTIDDSQLVSDLHDVIKERKMYQFPADDLQLFLAKRDDGKWLSLDEAAAVALDEEGRLQGFEPMNPGRWIKNPKHFGEDFQAKQEEVHVLVVLPTTSEPALKRQRLHVEKSLAETWDYSELQLRAFPSVHQLVTLLQKPLPFRLLLNRQSEGLFEPNGPLISCDDLEACMKCFPII